MTFAVLFVCTGNICRSPMAERLFRARTSGVGDLAVSSAGTAGLTGYPMDAPSARALLELGGDPDGHAARRARAADIEAADLVLTASEEHRAALLAMVPLAFRRTFTMREFARLGAEQPPLSGVTEQALRDRVRAVAGERGFAPSPAPGADDIGDPFGASMDVARRAGNDVSEAVDAIIRALGLATVI